MTDGFSFSVPLKLRLKTYFKERYSLEMTDEEANLFLGSLARVYDALTQPGQVVAEGVGAEL